VKTKVNAGKISRIRHMDLVRFWYGPRRGNGQVNATHGEGALTFSVGLCQAEYRALIAAAAAPEVGTEEGSVRISE